jgi:hypothetical protein
VVHQSFSFIYIGNRSAAVGLVSVEILEACVKTSLLFFFYMNCVVTISTILYGLHYITLFIIIIDATYITVTPSN